jgi:hypothetical protein
LSNALYISKLALFNQSESSPLILTNVFEGVDGASAFGYTNEQTSVQVGANRKQVIADNHTIDITVVNDRSAIATITEWANTPSFDFRLSAYGGDTFLIFDDPTKLVFPAQFDTIMTRRLGLTLSAPAGYTGTAPNVKLPVFAGCNALSLYKHWEGSAQLMNGFQVVTTNGTTAWNGATQRLVLGASEELTLLSQPLLFPFPDAQITASMTSINDGLSGGFDLGFRFLEADETTEVSVSATSLSGEGRKSHTATVPATTAYIQFYVDLSGTVGQELEISTPAIRLGTTSTYDV